MESILFYSDNEIKKSSVKDLCRKLKIKFIPIGSGDIKATLLSLVSGRGCSKDIRIPVLYTQPELMVFSSFDDAKLDLFLAAYKSAGIEPVKLKAVLTPYNIGWTVYELTGELQKESASIGG